MFSVVIPAYAFQVPATHTLALHGITQRCHNGAADVCPVKVRYDSHVTWLNHMTIAPCFLSLPSFPFIFPRLLAIPQQETKMEFKKSLKLFSVVVFNKDKTFSVVPSSWITQDRTKCFWPDKKGKKGQELQKDPASVPGKTWKLHPCIVKKSFGKWKIICDWGNLLL